MGYSEVLCHICGVSFNIARLRRADEPASAAWDSNGFLTTYPNLTGAGHSYVNASRNSHNGECHRGDECMIQERDEARSRSNVLKLQASRLDQWLESEQADDKTHDAEEGSDADYVYESSDGEEAYEYITPAESEDEGEDNETPPSDLDEESDLTYDQFRQQIEQFNEVREGPVAEPEHKPMLPLFRPLDRDDASEHGSDASFDEGEAQPVGASVGIRMPDPSGRKLEHWLSGKLSFWPQHEQHYEHIAGRGCRNRCGYSGHRISVEEMRGCQTSQCLVLKDDDWKPEADDEDFERKGGYFLSGLSDAMPSRDMDRPTMVPVRHGCSSPSAENCRWDPDEYGPYAMPFHPTCLEIYKRASLLRDGRVDIAGLTAWWELEAHYDEFHLFPRDAAVEKARCQMWEHNTGDEFLAANPCFVPALREILEMANCHGEAKVSLRDNAFQHLANHNAPETTPDTFAGLPEELRIMILNRLSSKDIANLRLASRTFRQLSQSVFQHLLMKEKPWLWEMWCSRPYSHWACTEAKEIVMIEKQQNDEVQQLSDLVNALTHEDLDAIHLLKHHVAVDMKARHAAERASWMSMRNGPERILTLGEIDYYQLSVGLARNWSELKGLKNRCRIWKDCEEILDRIEQYRGEGKFE